MLTSSFLKHLGAVALATLAIQSVAHAQSDTWTSGVTGNWSSNINWQDGSAPAPGGSITAQLTFVGGNQPIAAAYNANNDLAGTYNLNRLITDTRYGFGTTTLTTTGNTIALTGASPQILQQGTASASIANSLSLLSANTTIGGAGNGYLNINGTIGGVGALTLDRSGFGYVILNGTNTYSGGTTLTNGNLGIGAAGALGSGVLTANGTGATLRFTSFVGPSGILLNNNISLTTSLVVGGNNSGILGGVVSGNGGLTLAPNTGITLRLANTNTYTGATRTGTPPSGGLAGTIQFEGANGAATVSSGFTVERFGGLILDNRTTLTSGIAGGNNTNRIGDSAALSLLSRGNVSFFANETTASSERMGALNTSGSPFVTVNQSITAANRTGTLRFSSYAADGASGTLFRGINLGGGTPGTLGNDNILFDDGAAVIALQIGGGGAAGSTNISILTTAFGHFNNSSAGNFGGGNSLMTYDATNGLRALNTTTEYATVAGGATPADNNVRLTTLQSGLDASATVNALVLERVSTTDYGRIAGTGTLNVTSGVIVAAGAGGNADINSQNRNRLDVQTLAFGARQAKIFAPEVMTIRSNITGSGGLAKVGGNNVALTGNNTGLTGSIAIGGGALVVGNLATNLGGSGAVALDGGTLNYSGAGAETFARGFELRAASGFVSISNAAGVLTSTGAITGGGKLVKDGAGTLVLQGANSYSGNTVINAGTLSTEDVASLGVGSAVVLGPGSTLRTTANLTMNKELILLAGGGVRALDVAAGTTLDWNGQIAHSGRAGSQGNALPLNKTGAGALNLNSATNGFDGALAVQGGIVRVNGVLEQINTSGAGISVGAGAGLGGNGTIRRDVVVNNNGIFTPGAGLNAIGTLSITGGTTFADNFGYDWNIGALGSDTVSVAGLLSFAGASIGTVNVFYNAGELLPSSSLLLFRSDTAIASFGNVSWLLNYAGSPGLSGGEVFLASPNEIRVRNIVGASVAPEASTIELLLPTGALALLGTLVVRRKREGPRRAA